MMTDDTLRKVREAARIDEVAAGYMTLARAGKDFVALCPFHDERHPSFRISPALNIGKCFSCGEAADPIRLVGHLEGCGFEEAVRLLAAKYGIEVEETTGGDTIRRRDERERLLRTNEAFARTLLPYEPEATDLPETDRMALTEAYRSFGVGLCPPEVPEGFRPFLGRLLFPVRTTGGQVAGFAGRRLGKDGEGPKYRNSPDSEAYRKGSILYGLHTAVKAIRSEGRVLLCEGYKDVIAFHACGIRHAVGLSGTALTEQHIRMIGRLTRHVILALDPDEAGRLNTLRSARLLLAGGLEVSLLPLPGGRDPDEIYREEGSETLARLAREGAVSYLSRRIAQIGALASPPPERITEVLGEISLLPSPLAVHLRIEELSRATGIPYAVLREETALTGQGRPAPRIQVASEPRPGPSPGELRERALLRFCLQYHDRMFYEDDGSPVSLPAWVEAELSANGIPFVHPDHVRLLEWLSGGRSPDEVTDERLAALLTLLRSSYPPDEETLPDDRLPEATEYQTQLYCQPFVHAKLAETLASLRTAPTPDERLRLQSLLEDYFALSDQIAKRLDSQSVIPAGS